MSDSSSDTSSSESSEDEMETAEPAAVETIVLQPSTAVIQSPAVNATSVPTESEIMSSTLINAATSVKICKPCKPAVHIPLDRTKEMEVGSISYSFAFCSN